MKTYPSNEQIKVYQDDCVITAKDIFKDYWNWQRVKEFKAGGWFPKVLSSQYIL